MKAMKILGLTTTVLGLTLAPIAAHAEDSTAPSTQTDSSGTTHKHVTKNTSKHKIDVDVTVKEKDKKASSAPKATNGSPSSASTAPAAPAAPTASSQSLESIRIEERARAAEEFRADQQRMEAQKDAEIERAREQERAMAAQKTDAQVAAARAEERARAQAEAEKDDKVIEDALLTPVGLYGFVGGGASNFTQPGAVGTASLGGYWDVRLGVGTRSVIGAEVSYVGGSRDINALGLDQKAFLINNGLEGVARLNVPITSKAIPVLLEPYTFGGIGWQHYNLVNASSNTSSVQSQDDIMTVPMGVGLQFGFNAFTVDTRLTYRHALGSNLLGTSTSSFDDTSLNSWGAGAALGFEF